MKFPRIDLGTLMLLILFAGIVAAGLRLAGREKSPFAGPGLLLVVPPAGFLMLCVFLIVYYRKI